MKIITTFFVLVPLGTVQAQIFHYKYLDRSAWGADEAIRFTTEAQPDGATRQVELWPREYQPIKKIILHVTAGEVPVGNGNYPTLIGNVARYHAKTLGWSDVGYNELIDPDGTVYEGRAGGSGVIAGHTHYGYKDTQTGVHVNYNLNSGSFGVALLGSFVNGAPPVAMLDGLAQFLADQAIEFGLDPLGSDIWRVPVTFKDPLPSPDAAAAIIDRTMVMFRSKGMHPTVDITDPAHPFIVITGVPNIVFHRDVDWTEDPPASLYALLPDIRNRVAAVVNQALANGITPRGSVMRQDATSLVMEPTENKTMTVTFHNNGPMAWDFVADRGVRLVDQTNGSLRPIEKLTSLAHGPVVNPLTIPRPDPAYIRPGSDVTFTIPVVASVAFPEQDRVFALAWGSVGTIAGTETRVQVTTILKDYAARYEGDSIPTRVDPGSTTALNLKFHNVGRNVWSKAGTRLRITDSAGAPLTIRTKKWKTSLGDFVPTTDIARDGTFTVSVPLQFPDILTKFPLKISLERLVGVKIWELIDGGSLTPEVEVYSALRADVLPGTLSLPRAKPAELAIRITNTGDLPIPKGTELRLTKPTGVPSSLRHRSWPSPTTAIKFDRDLAPGASTLFLIPTRIYYQRFIGTLRLSLDVNKKTVYLERQLFLLRPLVIK